MEPPMSIEVDDAVTTVKKQLRDVYRLLRQLNSVHQSRTFLSANKTLEESNKLAVQFDQEQLATKIGAALSDASARMFILTEVPLEDQEPYTTHAFDKPGDETLVLNELSIQQLKIDPYNEGKQREYWVADVDIARIALPANNQYVLSAVADFVLGLQHGIGDPNRPKSHPGHRVRNYEEDFVVMVDRGLCCLLDWLRMYGCAAWFHDLCDHVKDVVCLAVQLMATLSRTYEWLFDSLHWPIAKELSVSINCKLKLIWDLLYTSGALSSMLVQGMALATGVLTHKEATKRRREQFTVKPSRKRTKTGVKVATVTCWPWQGKPVPDIMLLPTEFIEAFALVFGLPVIAARRVLHYLEYDWILQCQQFVEFWAAGGGKATERVERLAVDVRAEPKRARVD